MSFFKAINNLETIGIFEHGHYIMELFFFSVIKVIGVCVRVCTRTHLCLCYRLNCVPPQNVEALTLNVVIFGDKAFKEVISIKQDGKSRTLLL